MSDGSRSGVFNPLQIDWKVSVVVLIGMGVSVIGYAYSIGGQVHGMRVEVSRNTSRLDQQQQNISADHDILIDVQARLRASESRAERIESKLDQLLERR